MYELDLYCTEIHGMCNMNFLREVFQSYCLTDRHTESTEIIEHGTITQITIIILVTKI